jgi:hypothetical protein
MIFHAGHRRWRCSVAIDAVPHRYFRTSQWVIYARVRSHLLQIESAAHRQFVLIEIISQAAALLVHPSTTTAGASPATTLTRMLAWLHVLHLANRRGTS